MLSREAYQILIGLGAGNIGDDMMMHAFWDSLPDEMLLHVAVFGNFRQQRQPYPARHRYYEYSGSGLECGWVRDMPAMLAGTSCITDAEGYPWPLGFLSHRFEHFHSHGLPIDVIAAGVDGVTTPEGRQAFQRHFVPVRSWTVRDEASRQILLELGVDPSRIAVGADWGWLYQIQPTPPGWAEETWRSTGIDPGKPLLVLNLFHQGGDLEGAIWRNLAAGLDLLHAQDGLQLAFLCNECRHPGFDLEAAQSLAARMRAPLALVPNLYYSPSEVISLLRFATVTVGRRYHFCVEAVQAGASHVNLGRGQKLLGLSRELGLEPCGSLTHLDVDEFCAAVRSAVAERPARIAMLQANKLRLQRRAANNLHFFLQHYGFAGNEPSATPADPAGRISQ